MGNRTKNVPLGWCSLAACLSFVLLAPAVEGATPQLTHQASKVPRVINGHRFVRSELAVWPFVSTYFGASTGVGLARFEQAGQDQDGNPIEGTLGVGALAESFDVGVALTPWLGLQADFRGLVLTGSDLESALNVGAIFTAAGRGRLVAQVLRHRLVTLLAGFQGGYMAGKRLQPLSLLNKGKLLTDVSAWHVGPVVAWAAAPTSWLGLSSSIGYEFGKSSFDDLSQTAHELAWATTINVDLGPVALPTTYGVSKGVGDGGETEHRVEGGLVYNGRENLDLGLIASTKIGSNDTEVVGAFRMYYHW